MTGWKAALRLFLGPVGVALIFDSCKIIVSYVFVYSSLLSQRFLHNLGIDSEAFFTLIFHVRHFSTVGQSQYFPPAIPSSILFSKD